MLKHYCGPSYPIHLVSGTKVLDPYQNPNRLTQDEAINILICQDPRRVSRHQNCHEGVSLKH